MAHSHHDHDDHGHTRDRAGHSHAQGDHGHAHGPGGHVHAPASFGMAFAIGISLNTVFVVIEAIYGYASGSMALVADAGHNLSDVLGLIAAWTAAVLSKRAPTPRFTYGLRGSSILAALFNAVFLLVAVGAIAWEGVLRLFNPGPVAEITVMIVATIGIVINGVTAWLFASGRNSDLNIRGAYLHMVADAAVSVGVVIAAIVIMFTGWLWIDALTSLVICALIVWGTWSLLRDSTAMSLAAVPRSIDPAAVRTYLEKCPGVAQVHDLHIWPMSTTEVALTCHMVIPSGPPGDAYLMEVAARLKRDFGIEHATIQIEMDPNSACALAPEHVI
ncbi:cation diffusion facilitator family transporter [Tardiphaga sp. 709]|uniref:cation diffusion facilitator family transporter n=1 Tax=Tardiphaga sp. 709 TaxID=3076039 RepID=UPI0028E478F8|nr:cation diffusion facilitator family transporter [Tardiphaga sp. 709]WNV07546.1 cation diffusion facilitator family transporter [Tardiphaga sp. 709]